MTIGPAGGAHGIGVRPVIAITSVPDTLITDAGMPANETAIGSTKPVPSILTFVPPNAEPVAGSAVVICILARYRNAAGATTDLPELTLRTFTSTGPVT